MNFLNKFTPNKALIEKLYALMTDNFEGDGTLIVDELGDEEISHLQKFTVGFTVENSEVSVIVNYRTDYANQLNFILVGHYFIVAGDDMYPLDIFEYPDGTISDDLFSDTNNYLEQFFGKSNE